MGWSLSFAALIASIHCCTVVRLLKRNAFYYKQEPLLFFKDFVALVKSGIKINVFKKTKHRFNPEEIKIMRDKKANVFDGDHPFNRDRAIDKEKRDKIEKKLSNK